MGPPCVEVVVDQVLDYSCCVARWLGWIRSSTSPTGTLKRNPLGRFSTASWFFHGFGHSTISSTTLNPAMDSILRSLTGASGGPAIGQPSILHMLTFSRRLECVQSCLLVRKHGHMPGSSWKCGWMRLLLTSADE